MVLEPQVLIINLSIGCHYFLPAYPMVHHRLLAGTKLYCLVTDAHVCEQLAQVVT